MESAGGRHRLLQVCSSQTLYNTRTLLKARPEYPISILKHAILQADHNKLAASEPGLDQSANILCVRKVQRGINFVENIHRRRLEL